MFAKFKHEIIAQSNSDTLRHLLIVSKSENKQYFWLSVLLFNPSILRFPFRRVTRV